MKVWLGRGDVVRVGVGRLSGVTRGTTPRVGLVAARLRPISRAGRNRAY